MARRCLSLAIAAVLLALALPTLAAENKVEKMTNDQTQDSYKRKSITYLGMMVIPGIVIDESQYGLVEAAIRSKIELKRFDYNNVNINTIYTVDQFVAELREFVKKRAADRAAAEAEYEARFKRAKVLATDIDRIMNSAYFYTIEISQLVQTPGKCPEGKMEALFLGCVPNEPGILATVNGTASFYLANLMDETKPPYTLIKTVSHVPVQGFSGFNPTELGFEKAAASRATVKAATTLSDFLQKEMKKIPDFNLKTPVNAVLADGVEFMLGDQEGVDLDETYEVTEFDAAGNKSLLGYVKVRNIGQAEGSGQGTASYAEKVKVKRPFVGGEQLYEHPMVGLSVGVNFLMQFTASDILGDPDKAGLYPGVGFYVDKNIAKWTKISELYLSIEGDALFVGKIADQYSVSLLHGMLGVKKKWYMESLVLSLGLRGGMSYYQVSDIETESKGFGGDVVAGMEYYFRPEFSLFLKGGGRFFTNPLDYGTGEVDPEMGAHLGLGAFYAF